MALLYHFSLSLYLPFLFRLEYGVIDDRLLDIPYKIDVT